MNQLRVGSREMKGLQIAEARLGMDELSRKLGAPDTTIRSWRMGHTMMPEAKWSKLVDILTNIKPDWDKDE